MTLPVSDSIIMSVGANDHLSTACSGERRAFLTAVIKAANLTVSRRGDTVTSQQRKTADS